MPIMARSIADGDGYDQYWVALKLSPVAGVEAAGKVDRVRETRSKACVGVAGAASFPPSAGTAASCGAPSASLPAVPSSRGADAAWSLCNPRPVVAVWFRDINAARGAAVEEKRIFP